MANSLIKLMISSETDDKPYLTFKAVEAPATISLYEQYTADGSYVYCQLQHRLGKSGEWKSGATNITLENVGDIVQIKNLNSNFASSQPNETWMQFIMTGKVEASGSIMSLLNWETSVPAYCFQKLFYGCTSLTTAPELPATELADYCYQQMFQGCTNLTSAPALPATTLALKCYYLMFDECSSLANAPELPATTLTTYCYQAMFRNCKSLTSAPALPATTLTTYCYHAMFQQCSSLVNAPVLPATKLAFNCYQQMFQQCSSLVNAPELPATELNNNCYSQMFASCTSLVTPPVLPATKLALYCYQNMFNGCTKLASAPVLPATTLANYCYASMFLSCSSLVTPPVLPATTLANYCYQQMFSGCKSLTTAPELPATTLALYCYQNMFNACTSLVTPPVLPATTLANYCYSGMFYRCTGLTSAPELPATTLANYCYQNMFYYCSSLVNAPELPASSLVSNCYNSMFYDCSSLSSITVGFSAWNGAATNNWVNRVASEGIFTAPSSLPVERGISRIPTNWTVENEPEDEPTPEIPTEGLVLYSSFNINSDNFTMSTDGMGTCETGQSMMGNYYIDPELYPGMNPPFFTKDGIPSFYSNYENWYAGLTIDDTGVPMNVEPVSFSIWYKDEGSENLTTPLLFTIGDMSSPGNAAIEPCFDRSSNTFYVMYSDDVVEYTLPDDFDITKWHHYVITCDYYNGTKIYLDGVLWQSFQVSFNFISVGVIGIGYSPAGGYGNNGWIASLRIYNYILTDDDVKALKSEFNPTDA